MLFCGGKKEISSSCSLKKRQNASLLALSPDSSHNHDPPEMPWEGRKVPLPPASKCEAAGGKEHTGILKLQHSSNRAEQNILLFHLLHDHAERSRPRHTGCVLPTRSTTSRSPCHLLKRQERLKSFCGTNCAGFRMGRIPPAAPGPSNSAHPHFGAGHAAPFPSLSTRNLSQVILTSALWREQQKLGSFFHSSDGLRLHGGIWELWMKQNSCISLGLTPHPCVHSIGLSHHLSALLNSQTSFPSVS